jgi:hypothetical protein
VFHFAAIKSSTFVCSVARKQKTPWCSDAGPGPLRHAHDYDACTVLRKR